MNRGVLQNTYIPSNLLHRDKQIKSIVEIVAPSLNKDKPSNILITGKTGTGKTAVVKYIGEELEKADMSNACKFYYINCETVDTPYSILYNISNYISIDPTKGIPFTGWSLEKAFKTLIEMLDKENKIFIIVLDEIDQSYKRNGDDIFYFLTTINEILVNSRVSIIGITNNSKFNEFLTPKIRSRLGEEKIIFQPYSPDELIDILNERAKEAFYPDQLDESVIPLIAAISAQDTGDARKALDLLRISADIAERNCDKKVTEAHVNYARQKMELDVSVEIVKSLTVQQKLVLLSIIANTSDKENKKIITGDVYSIYQVYSKKLGLPTLTQRRVADIISELDMLGLINARVRSLGKKGRTKIIELNIPLEVQALVTKDPTFKDIDLAIVSGQKTLDW